MFEFAPPAIRSESLLSPVAQDPAVRDGSRGCSTASRRSPRSYVLLLPAAARAVIVTTVRAFAADHTRGPG
jgi:hypothetical protein